VRDEGDHLLGGSVFRIEAGIDGCKHTRDYLYWPPGSGVGGPAKDHRSSTLSSSMAIGP
jgi:hypothetical protein